MAKSHIITKECQYHGTSEFVLEKTGYYKCKKCRVDNVTKRRHKIKRLAVEYKGGCCSICGYNKSVSALEFHHSDPTKKEFGISTSGNTVAWKRIKKELDKCVMICANCHREIHEKIHNLNT